MKKNIKGFSLLIAMGLVIIISLLAITILEYIIPFSRDIKGVENSSVAYYQANSAVEEALYDVYIRNNSGAITDTDEYSDLLDFNNNIDYGYNTISSGSILPPLGEGNSEYDDDDGDLIIDNNWDTISSGNPIQLSIGEGNITTDLEIAFRVPNLDRSTLITETLSGNTLAVVNWQLSAETNTLNASGSLVKADDVLDSSKDFSDNSFTLWTYDGSDLNGDSKLFSNFYTTNCGTNSGCTLKFSVVNKLETEGSESVIIPYLEWMLKIDSTKNIPLRYTKIESVGKAYGFKKELEVKVAGNTVNEAFDFTVFQ